LKNEPERKVAGNPFSKFWAGLSTRKHCCASPSPMSKQPTGIREGLGSKKKSQICCKFFLKNETKDLTKKRRYVTLFIAEDKKPLTII